MQMITSRFIEMKLNDFINSLEYLKTRQQINEKSINIKEIVATNVTKNKAADNVITEEQIKNIKLDDLSGVKCVSQQKSSHSFIARTNKDTIIVKKKFKISDETKEEIVKAKQAAIEWLQHFMVERDYLSISKNTLENSLDALKEN